ncbi:hypothetical protein B9Z55_000084 [Caenorhabditis nigoni]|nr:hypothetical protein B9Z55_000084 [Caenorhabditis nigoni]
MHRMFAQYHNWTCGSEWRLSAKFGKERCGTLTANGLKTGTINEQYAYTKKNQLCQSCFTKFPSTAFYDTISTYPVGHGLTS